MNSKDNEKLLVTPAEACQLLGVGRTTMYAWIKNGTIPVVRFPNCRNIYISKNTLNQLINENTIPANI
jgi:excisionase family DNA binding protein